MINNETPNESEKTDETPETVTKPDDTSGMLIQSFFKISDPETGEIYIQGRA